MKMSMDKSTEQMTMKMSFILHSFIPADPFAAPNEGMVDMDEAVDGRHG